jgi:trehalose synthase
MSVAEAARPREVEVQALDAARLEPLIGPDRLARYEAIAEATQRRLAGRAVLNVNSTATGGGVAEMLQTLLAYGRGAGLDVRWLVIQGDPEFFAITKRIHNGLYGSPGDGAALGDAEHLHYERVRLLAARVRSLLGLPRAYARDSAFDRSVLREERADLAAKRPACARVRRPPRR